MEYDKITLASDADRRLAEAKKLTLEPLHGDIAQDKEPDAAVVARHLTEGALANAPNDTEQTAVSVQPSTGLLGSTNESRAVRQGKSVIIATTVLVVVGIVVTAISLSL
jgi:hypothetical protein